MRSEKNSARSGRRSLSRRGRWLAAPVLVIAAVGVAGGPVDARPDAARAEITDVVDVLQLGCEGVDGDVAEIACRWTTPNDAAGVIVVRTALGTGHGRQIVFRTMDSSVNSFVDSPVRRGVRYLYSVRALDGNGSLLAASRLVVAGVAAQSRPTVDVLRLDCSATGRDTVRCEWATPEPPARVLTLWRSVDGGARERVASFTNPFPSSYGDVVPSGTTRAVYAVIATDGAGEIVARSRPDGVALPTDDTGGDGLVATPVERPVEQAVVTPTTTSVPADVPIVTQLERPDVVARSAPTTVAAAAVTPTTVVESRPDPVRPVADVPQAEPSDRGRQVDQDASGRVARSDEQDRAG